MELEYYTHKKTKKIYLLVEEKENGDIELIFPDGAARLVSHGSEQFSHFEGPLELEEEVVKRENLEPNLYALMEAIEDRKEKLVTKIEYLPDIDKPKNSWKSTRLTFYKDGIASLKEDEFFECIVENEGSFIMSKKQFMAKFKSVINDEKYDIDGYFNFDSIPEVAKELKKEQDERRDLEADLDLIENLIMEIQSLCHQKMSA